MKCESGRQNAKYEKLVLCKLSFFDINLIKIPTCTRIPWYSAEMYAEEVLSKILNFKLLQLAIDKYVFTYSIDELPIYAQCLAKLNFTIQPKENPNG